MGYWGTGLYQNDISLDVKDSFEDKWREELSSEKITASLIEEFEGIEDYPEDEAVFWLALADSQWKKGMLLSDVKDKALRWIERLLEPSEEDFDEFPVREKELLKLRDRLLTPQPKQKHPGKRKLYVCPWKIGDVYALRLESDLAREKGLYGRYLLLRKVSVHSSGL